MIKLIKKFFSDLWSSFCEGLAVVAVVAFCVGLFALIFWWPVYKFKDCKRVGHTTLYCTMNFLGGN